MNRRRILIIAVVGLFLATAGLFIIPRFLELETYRPYILDALKSQLHREFRYSRGSLLVGWGVRFTFHDVVVEGKSGGEPLLTARKASVEIPLIPLLRGEISLRGVSLDDPRIRIVREKDGSLSVDDLLGGEGGSSALSHLQLADGSVIFEDRAVPGGGFVTALSAVDLDIRGLRRGHGGPAHLRLSLGEGTVDLKGKLTLAPPSEPLRKSSFTGRVTVGDLDPWILWPYIAPHVAFRRPGGVWSTTTELSGTIDSFTAEGEISLRNGRLDFPSVFHGTLTPRAADLRYRLVRTPDSVDIPRVDCTVDGVRVKGTFRMSGLSGRDPRITATATSTPIDLSRFGVYIPYGIIERDVADWIERHIRGGKLTVVSGKLDGTVSQILSLGVGTNYDAIAVDARIEEGIVSYGSSVPLFTRVSGRLSLEGKDFVLRGMRGFFGTSPLSLDGRITEYVPTPVPCSFPFTMTMTPAAPEVAWFLGKEWGKRLSFGGESALTLKGEGPVADYSLSGAWQLGNATLSMPGVVAKPGGVKAALSFSTRFRGGKMTLSSFTARLASLTLSGGGELALSPNGVRGTLAGETNRFGLAEIAPFVPRLNPLNPSGSVTGKVAITVRDGGVGAVELRGALHDAAMSVEFLPVRISSLNGPLVFDGTTLSSEGLTGTFGSSRFTLRGEVGTGEKHPFRIFVTSPRLLPEDMGFLKPDREVRIAALRGEILGEGDRLTLRSLSTQINGSPLTVSGIVTTGPAPSAKVVITSPMLRFNDLIPLSALRFPERDTGAGERRLRIAADISADNGTIGEVRFSALETTVEMAGGILYLNPFSVELYGGTLSGTARVDAGKGVSRYQLEYEMEGVDVAKFLPALGFDRQKITGKLRSRGNLTCRGEDLRACEETMLGRIEFGVSRGSIDRFPVLSKVFSILNVSQLFRFRLPDMVKNGMPYREITGSIGVADGVARTDDFFIRSEAMNISAVGSIDLPKSRIDATIGVQPLQTVDSLVSRIPVVGWILTGKDRRLITAYFEAKGNVEDPQVNAIPVKSLARGTLEIFQRIFSLPARLITDSGEVILNR